MPNITWDERTEFFYRSEIPTEGNGLYIFSKGSSPPPPNDWKSVKLVVLFAAATVYYVVGLWWLLYSKSAWALVPVITGSVLIALLVEVIGEHRRAARKRQSGKRP